MPTGQQTQVEVAAYSVHPEGLPPTGLEHLAALRGRAPNFILCAMWLVDSGQRHAKPLVETPGGAQRTVYLAA